MTALRAATARPRSRVTALAEPRWLWLALPWLSALALYAPIFPSLIREWTESQNLSHGFAVPFIAAYLVYARRDRLRTLAPHGSLWGLPILLLGLIALIVGARGDEPFLARVSLPVTLAGLALFVAGWTPARVLLPGIAYLVFMIPLPWTTLKSLTDRSRLLDATAAAHALSWLGVPVNREGVFLHLPNITLEVADACSSIPAIAALLCLGAAYAFLTNRPTAVRILLILTTLPLAITANIIRIVSVSWAAYYLGPWTLKTAFHMFNGTVNFVLTLFLLVALDAGLARIRGWDR